MPGSDLSAQAGAHQRPSSAKEIIRKTYSLCPVCLTRLPAEIVKREHEYFLEKSCRDHGRFSTIVWRGESPSFEQWGNYAPSAETEEAQTACPNGCGLCPSHLRKTCCAVVEVTNRCNLTCPYCFAQSGNTPVEPTVDQLSRYFTELVNHGNTFVQLSGGEPTVRDDLPEIVAAAKKAGCENIQLNSNGIRLGQDSAYTKALAEAGLSFVFMQFDGTNDFIYAKLRGRPLLTEKHAAIKACSNELIGVTLVPTLVPGINDQNVGEILDFGLSSSPAVRGVHFQPVSYFGRFPEQPRNETRITLPEILHAIERQTGGKLKISDFVPSGCDHPKCGFHGDFVALPDSLVRLTRKTKLQSCCGPDGTAHIKNRRFVARRWKRTAADCCGGDDIASLDGFLSRIRSNGFTITAMNFQDAYTIDLERLRQCSVHVYENGRTIPFCAKYLTGFPAER